jgi:NTE family protein
LPVIQRPAAFKMRFDSLISSLGSHLPFRRKPAEELMRIEQEITADGLTRSPPGWAKARPQGQQPAAAPRPKARQSPRPARSSSITSALLRCST